jgi:hypothetical protein
MAMEQREFRIGYNLLWRLTFFLFAICLLIASIVLLIQSLLGASEGVLVPSSMLVAAILMSLYLIPFISTRQQVLAVATGGLELVGDHSRIVLPWESIADVRFKRVMLVMPYLIIALSSKERFAQFIDENPRSFLSKWTAHVGVLRWYPWLLRWLFSVPKNMTTVAKLEWLERRYGGAIVIDVAAVNGRGRELQRAIKAKLKKVAPSTTQ